MPFVKNLSDLGALGVEVVAISPFSLVSEPTLPSLGRSASADENSRRAKRAVLVVGRDARLLHVIAGYIVIQALVPLREAPPRTR